MGYYVQTTFSDYSIPAENVNEAYNRFVKLNDYDDAKRGGSWGGEFDCKTPRPDGFNYHPGRWYSWMEADYPSHCANAAEVLEHLGFNITLGEDQQSIFIISYDDKTGQEDIFLDEIYDLSRGQIHWLGEDGMTWETKAGNYEGLLQTNIDLFKNR